MAITVTIDTPTVDVESGVYSVAVNATATDGVNTWTKSFATSATKTDTAARLEVVNALTNDINRWKANLTKKVGAAAVMTQLKTAIEGLING